MQCHVMSKTKEASANVKGFAKELHVCAIEGADNACTHNDAAATSITGRGCSRSRSSTAATTTTDGNDFAKKLYKTAG